MADRATAAAYQWVAYRRRIGLDQAVWYRPYGGVLDLEPPSSPGARRRQQGERHLDLGVGPVVVVLTGLGLKATAHIAELLAGRDAQVRGIR